MFCLFQFILWLFVVILPVHPLLVCYLYFRRDNKQLINSLGTSIKARVRAQNLLLYPPAAPHSLEGSAGPDWGTEAISVTHGQQCALCFSSSPHTEGLWLCQSISGSAQWDSPISRLCVHHPAGRGSPTVGKVPCEPQSWDSEGKCCMVLLQAERPLSGGQVVQRAHIQILKVAPNYQTHQSCRSNWNW